MVSHFWVDVLCYICSIKHTVLQYTQYYLHPFTVSSCNNTPVNTLGKYCFAIAISRENNYHAIHVQSIRILSGYLPYKIQIFQYKIYSDSNFNAMIVLVCPCLFQSERSLVYVLKNSLCHTKLITF